MPITLRISRLYRTEQKMNELTKRDVKKGELAYLGNIQDIHNTHMELLFDLMQHPTLGTNIPHRPGARFLSESRFMQLPLKCASHIPYKAKGYVPVSFFPPRKSQFYSLYHIVI